MKYTLAGKKIDRAIDALIDLQQDYNEEAQQAEILYDLQTVIDKLNGMNASLDMKS